MKKFQESEQAPAIFACRPFKCSGISAMNFFLFSLLFAISSAFFYLAANAQEGQQPPVAEQQPDQGQQPPVAGQQPPADFQQCRVACQADCVNRNPLPRNHGQCVSSCNQQCRNGAFVPIGNGNNQGGDAVPPPIGGGAATNQGAGIGGCVMTCANTCLQARGIPTDAWPIDTRFREEAFQCVNACNVGCLGQTGPIPGVNPVPENNPDPAPENDAEPQPVDGPPMGTLPEVPEVPFEGNEINAVNDCENVLVDQSAIPAGFQSFAVPFSSTGSGELLMGIYCSGGQIEANIGNNNPVTYIHQTAFIAKENDQWNRFPLQGNKTADGEWYIGNARGVTSVPEAELDKYHFLVSYICNWDNQWQCGCDADSCDNGKWNIQTFRKK